jgi:hypothetical protein
LREPDRAARSARSEGRSALAAQPSRDQGSHPPASREGQTRLGETRGTFHRPAAQERWTFVQRAVLGRVSPQLVTSLWRARGAFFDPRLSRRP